MKTKKLLCLLLSLAMLLGMFAACGSTSTDSTASESEESTTASEEVTEGSDDSAENDESSASAEGVVEASDATSDSSDSSEANTVTSLTEVSLPLVEEETTISFWIPYPFFMGSMIEDMGEDVLVLSELQSRTGITFDITAINGETEADQFSLMIVSGDYCDVISDMANYSTGYDAAIDEGIILDLYDLVQEYAPNYWYYLTQDTNTLATLLTDEGHLPTIATLYKESGAENQGYAIRQDWLDELGMDTPTTYDELAEFIEACNTTYGSQGIYFNAEGSDPLFAFGFDCGQEFVVIDGEVTHAYLRDEYYDYLSTAADWYSRGLIYQDFYLYGTDDTMDQMFCSGGLAVDAARCTSYNGTFESFTDADYNATYAPLALVKLNEDDEIHYSTTVGSLVKREDTWAVTESCDDPELVMALVNYLYSEDGQLLFNWGVEGETYTLDDNGDPEYTDLVINNEEMAYLYTAFLYATNSASEYAPSIMDISKQYYSFDDTAWAAYEVYLDDGADGSYNYPDGAALTADETEGYSSISSDIETYADTQILAFITGQTELNEETWAEFQETLISMGIETMIEYKQAAYDRYAEKLAGLQG